MNTFTEALRRRVLVSKHFFAVVFTAMELLSLAIVRFWDSTEEFCPEALLAKVIFCASTDEFCPIVLLGNRIFSEELLARMTFCASTDEFCPLVLLPSVMFPACDEFSAPVSFARELI